jgi:hypothetical protein
MLRQAAFNKRASYCSKEQGNWIGSKASKALKTSSMVDNSQFSLDAVSKSIIV